jgi:two-component system, cell cycle sensor histidine kinase PleC
MQLEVKPVAAASLIEEVLRIVGPRAAEEKIEIAVDVVPRDLMLEADRRALKQVLINIASNAVKFTPVGGKVSIGASAENGVARFVIADNGVGIPKQDIDKLGRPFEQLENQFTKTKGGSGLGLAISMSLIELHGGSIAIDSEVGKGTTVIVSLPLAHEPAHARAGVTEPA